MAMAAKTNETEITNAMPKSVVHIRTPQWPRPCHRDAALGHWVELGGSVWRFLTRSVAVALAQGYTANFYSGSQHFTSLPTSFVPVVSYQSQIV